MLKIPNESTSNDILEMHEHIDFNIVCLEAKIMRVIQQLPLFRHRIALASNNLYRAESKLSYFDKKSSLYKAADNEYQLRKIELDRATDNFSKLQTFLNELQEKLGNAENLRQKHNEQMSKIHDQPSHQYNKVLIADITGFNATNLRHVP